MGVAYRFVRTIVIFTFAASARVSGWAIIIRQKKRPRFLFRHFRSGTSIKTAAGAAFSGRGRWFCSNCLAVKPSSLHPRLMSGCARPPKTTRRRGRHSCPVAGRKANYDTHRQRPEPREVSLSLGIVCTSASTGGRPVQSTPLTHGRFRGRAACRSAEGRATGARDQLAAMCAATALQAGLERTPWFARIWTRAIRIAR